MQNRIFFQKKLVVYHIAFYIYKISKNWWESKQTRE
nr:MAG TPA: hypothetical protein [Caudoviricetes sp.]